MGGIDLLKDIKAELPKSIIRNKQVFEAIFTQLQLHPCYLINWITKSSLNRQPKEAIHVIESVYGKEEIYENKRLLHVLMVIGRR